jgi:hypothetical protein
MTTEQPEKIWSTVDIVKVVGGGLAAVSAAVAASTLGVAGTLSGAAIASVIGALGTELYTNSFKRGYGRLRKAKPGLVRVLRTDDAVPMPHPAGRDAASDATTVIPVTSASATGAAGVYGPVKPSRPRWKRIALLAVAVFVLAMAAIWLVEVFAGESLAAVFGKDAHGTTTIGSVVGGSEGNRAPAPGVTPTSTEVTPSATTTPVPTGTSPAPVISPEPTTTTVAPPATGAPETTGPTPGAPSLAPTIAPTGGHTGP